MFDLYRCIAQGEPVYLPEDQAPQPAQPIDRFILSGQYITPSGVLKASDLRDDLAAARNLQSLFNSLPDVADDEPDNEPDAEPAG